MGRLGSARRAVAYGILGALTGVAAAAAASVVASAVAQSATAPHGVLDVTHSPALLRATGDPSELVYEVHCVPPGVEDPEAACAIRGSVFARARGERSFRELPLERSPVSRARFVASIPHDLVDVDVFEYFAVVASSDTGTTVTVPAGGAAAATISRRLDGAVRVDLGRHRFGRDRARGERVAGARWGTGLLEVGLEAGPRSGPIGAAALDVDAKGTILVLDHANRKLLRWTRDSHLPERLPISVNGTIADLASGDDGTIYVLETTSRDGRNPLVRRFDDHGRELEAFETAERGPAQIRMGPDGPLVLQRPSNQWMPALVAGTPASPAAQRSRGRDARRLRTGGEIALLRRANELRLARIAGGSIAQSWHITSETSLAEVQLAEPMDTHAMVVVLRVYEERHDEFAVLLLDRRGLRAHMTVDAADWAEGSPLGRVRLAGRSLYRLGTSPTGVFVDRFDLEDR
jgi:hypothetical protein